MTRRRLLGAAGAGLLAACSGCNPSRGRSGGRELVVWHPWGGVMVPRFQKVLETFEKAHPGVTVRPVYTQNNLSTNQKFFTAVAAETAPDVIFVDGPQVASWAEWGALEPLGERVRAAGIRPDDYFPPTWRQNFYKNDVWALTYCADPNFGFAWNKAAFRRAKLDPERPPQTIDELTDYAERLTEVRDGVIRNIGLIPWAQYGPANSIFTWGWAFGGVFYDDAAHRITADHPRIVRALDWMAGFAKKYDPAKISSLQQGFGTAENNPFYSGTLAMQCLHIGGIGEIERFAPDLDYGIGYLPAPPDGEAKSCWVGGWCMAIPKGARNQDGAWEFLRWLCHSPEGTNCVASECALFPGMRHSPYLKEVRNRFYYGDYLRLL